MLDIAVACAGLRRHVIFALPHLVAAILAQRSAALQPIGDLRRWIPQQHRTSHARQGTTASVPAVDKPRRRIGAYVLCRDDADRILLARSPGPQHTWFLPGGGLDFGEHPQLGALRELREETGYVGELDALLGFTVLQHTAEDGARWDVVAIVYRAHVTGGELTAEVDGSTDHAAWVNPRQLTQARTGRLVKWALAQPIDGGTPVSPYDGPPQRPSGLREVTVLAAGGIAVPSQPPGQRSKGCAVTPGGIVEPGENPTSVVGRAWSALGTGVTVGRARWVTSDVLDDPIEAVRRWTVRVLYDVDIN